MQQDLSRKTNVSVNYPRAPEAKAASTCLGVVERTLEFEDLGVCSISTIHGRRGVGSGPGRDPSASETLTSSVKSQRVVVKLKHRLSVKTRCKL